MTGLKPTYALYHHLSTCYSLPLVTGAALGNKMQIGSIRNPGSIGSDTISLQLNFNLEGQKRECLAPFCDIGLQNEANKEERAEKETDQVLMSLKASDQALLDSSGLLSYLSPYILFPLASLSKVFCLFVLF